MYLLHLYFKNARESGTGELCFKTDDNKIAKWTLLPPGKSGLELLRLIALASGGTRLFAHLPFELQRLCREPGSPLQVEFVVALHAPYETRPNGTMLWGSGIRVDAMGQVCSLSNSKYCFLSSDIRIYRAKLGIGNSGHFLLGYGAKLKHHEGTDDFDFTDPFFRLTRFSSLFLDQSLLTDPVEFLTDMHYRGVRHKRKAPMHVLERFARLFKEHLAIPTESWLARECDFRHQWYSLAPWQQRAILPILDAARHLIEAFQKHVAPLDIACLVLFDRPDQFCTEDFFPRWVKLLDAAFPAMQVVATVAEQAPQGLGNEIAAATCPIPLLPAQPSKPPPLMPRGAILLLDIDSLLPNLALMKLGRYFKEQGKRVILAGSEARPKGVEVVYASCVFFKPTSQQRVRLLQSYYGDALVLGGSGVDVTKRLPVEVEKGAADYSLYPNMEDRGIGFLTRGCPFLCPFCIVPLKEGKPRQVSTLAELLPDNRKKLILLDDNILAHPGAGDFLEEMAVRGLEVNFTQTLDLLLLDQQKVSLLKRVQCTNIRFTRHVYHFSLNDNRNLDKMRRKYDLFGFNSKDNVEFVCMYGFNTTLAEDVERFRFLRSLPGAYVFVQEYMPMLGGPPANHEDFFDERADELIDELIRIMFTQNMKNMEKYYRWVSKLYAQTFAKLHPGLVDTLFRYNDRQNKGFYISTLAGLNKNNEP